MLRRPWLGCCLHSPGVTDMWLLGAKPSTAQMHHLLVLLAALGGYCCLHFTAEKTEAPDWLQVERARGGPLTSAAPSLTASSACGDAASLWEGGHLGSCQWLHAGRAMPQLLRTLGSPVLSPGRECGWKRDPSPPVCPALAPRGTAAAHA